MFSIMIKVHLTGQSVECYSFNAICSSILILLLAFVMYGWHQLQRRRTALKIQPSSNRFMLKLKHSWSYVITCNGHSPQIIQYKAVSIISSFPATAASHTRVHSRTVQCTVTHTRGRRCDATLDVFLLLIDYTSIILSRIKIWMIFIGLA